MKTAQHTVIPKKCHLYQQPKSANWFCRIKVESGKWVRLTTREEDFEAAFERAHELYFEVRTKAQNNIPIQTKTFSSVAKSIVAQLEAKKGTKSWKQTYKHYVFVINKYQIPYFKNTKLENIKDAFEGYLDFVTEQIGRKPAASTLNNHHAALRLVLDEAIANDWVSKAQLPTIDNEGRASSRRASFDLDEYNKLTRRLRSWKEKDTHRIRDKEQQELLYDYVLLLAYSGIRSGREALDIEWKNVNFAKSKNGNNIITINVLMKKGRSGDEKRRDVVLRHNRLSDARAVLERLKNRQVDLAHLSLEELVSKRTSDKLIAFSDGTQPQRLDGTFKKFLIDADLLIGKDGQKRTLYSLRHFYATQELSRKNPISIHLLAKQMGTSTKMIEQHYSHLEVYQQADRLSGNEEFD